MYVVKPRQAINALVEVGNSETQSFDARFSNLVY